ncbi:adenosine deaminase/editase [Mycena latifolia]|nr:adenosine deaminase/editase [Mycena latifolia]
MEDASLVEPIMALYRTLPLQPPAQQYTVLASFCLTSDTNGLYKIVSLASGTKCLPVSRLPVDGEAVHDSHAEVLARRGAVRWFLEEIGRCRNSSMAFQSDWICPCDDGRYALKDDIRLVLYVSTPPCGDASMRFLAAAQDEQMAALKDSAVYAPLAPNAAARGRDNYALWGVLRTKPGRADSPPTTSMSCSDKIAAWNYLGIQGALGSRFLRPLYVHSIVIGEVPSSLQPAVSADCARALWGRLAGILDCGPYALHEPRIHFTAVPFVHSRSLTPRAGGSCNDSLWWIADSTKPAEVLINGYKRGVAPQHRHRDRSRYAMPFIHRCAIASQSRRPQACKKSVLQLYHETLRVCALSAEADSATYATIKQSMAEFQAAKQTLMGGGGPFRGWIRGPSSQNFNAG